MFPVESFAGNTKILKEHISPFSLTFSFPIHILPSYFANSEFPLISAEVF